MNYLLQIVDSAMPMQFFEVKRHSKPKGQQWLLRTLTISVCLIGVAIFVALFISQSFTYTTETVIKLSDITDAEWSCSMASVITQSISIDSTSEPSQYYNLMGVNELKSDCLRTLHNTDPCVSDSAIMFMAGSTDIPQQLDLISSSAAATTLDDTFYFIVPAGSVGVSPVLLNLQAYKYNLSSGILTQGILGSSESFTYPSQKQTFARSSVAMGRKGDGIFLVYSDESYDMTFFNGEIAYPFGLQGDSVLLTNDNHHSVYVVVSKASTSKPGTYTHALSYFMIITEYQTPESNLQGLFNFQTDNNMTVLQIGIYCTYKPPDATSPPPVDSIYLYYMTGSEDDFTGDLYVRHNGVSTLLLVSSYAYQVAQLMTFQISSWENKVYIMYLNETIIRKPNKIGHIYKEFNYIASIDYQGQMEHCSTIYSDDGLDTFALVQNETQFIYTNVAANDLLFQRALYNSTINAPLLSGFEGSTSGWFVCGDQLVTSGLPPDIYSNCGANGISWQLQYNDAYFSTADAFAQRAISEAAQQCNASLYTAICDRVGALPPYICSRKVYLPFFTALATAIANAHLLMVVLFVVAGVVLSKTKKFHNAPGVDSTVKTKGNEGVELNPMNSQI